MDVVNFTPHTDAAEGLVMLWDAALKTRIEASDDAEDKTEDLLAIWNQSDFVDISDALSSPIPKRLRCDADSSPASSSLDRLTDDCIVCILEHLISPPVSSTDDSWPYVLRGKRLPAQTDVLKFKTLSRRFCTLMNTAMWRICLGDRRAPMLQLNLTSLVKSLPSYGHLRYLEIQHCCMPEWGVLLLKLGDLCPSLISVEFSLLRSEGPGGVYQRGLQRDDLHALFSGCLRLKYLALDDCLAPCANNTLCPLPESIFDLASLERLYINKLSSALPFLSSLPRISKLRVLELHQLPDIDALPPALAGLPMLQILVISGARHLRSLPPNLGELISLETLQLYNLPALVDLPSSIEHLSALSSLEITNCPNIITLPVTIGALTQLCAMLIIKCQQLLCLPDTCSSLTSLQCLSLVGCKNLGRLPPWIADLTGLEFLSLRKSEWLRTVSPWLLQLPVLSVLDVVDCHSLKGVPQRSGLRVLSAGEVLSDDECDPALTSLPDKKHAHWLEQIERATV